jgi:cysteine synthase A
LTKEVIHDSVLGIVGNTPIVRLSRLDRNLKCELLAKLELFNPMSSVKDRIAKSMIEAAEKERVLKPGMSVVEPTSGNTGIGLAMVAAAKGYPLILTMPDTMSEERIKILRALGAELVLTPGSEGMAGSITKAENLAASEPKKYFVPQQFMNPANPKEKLQDITIVAVEPEDSPVLSKGEKGPHKIQGIGAGFVPEVLDRDVIDEVRTVSYDSAASTTRLLARQEGIFAGISSGAALSVALDIARGLSNDKRVLTLLPDTGERYLSTELFSNP